MPWAFFYGASQNQVCGGGSILHLSQNHSFQFQMGLGYGSKKFAELMALKLLLYFSLEKGCKNIHIFGDSLIIINWVNKVQHFQILDLLTLYEEVLRLWTSFDHITCHHVYKEWNAIADRLSKDGIGMDFGTWKFFVHKDGEVYELYHIPFAETFPVRQLVWKFWTRISTDLS